MNGPTEVPEYGQPDNRTADARAADEARAADQVARMMERLQDPGRRRDYLRQLRDRRNQGRPDERIEVVEVDERSGEEPDDGDPPDGGPPEGFRPGEYLVDDYELITTTDAVEDAQFQAVLDDLGWERAPLRDDERRLEDRIARLRCLERPAWGVEEELRRFRAQTQHAVTLSYVVAFGAVMKGGETPTDTSAPSPQRPAPTSCHDVPIAVLDTGIAFQVRRDHWLMDLLREGEEDRLDVLPPPEDGFLDAGAGHGSFVAGIVQQIVPDARIKVYQVLDTDGLASETRVGDMMVGAVDEMLDVDGCLILNLSLGTDTIDDQPPLSFIAALDKIEAIAGNRSGEVLLVAAAGNDGTARPNWPAAFGRTRGWVVGVAALDPQLAGAFFSSRGDWVRCSTVGIGIRSTFVQGKEAPEFATTQPPKVWGPDSWGQWFGTSFAAPQVAAAVAKHAVAQPATTPRLAAALAQLLGRGSPLQDFGVAVRIL